MEGGSKCVWHLKFTTDFDDEYYFGIINELDVAQIFNDFKWWTGDSFKGYGFNGKRGKHFDVKLCLDIKNGNLSYIDNDDEKNENVYKISRHMKYRLAVSFINNMGNTSIVEIIDFDVV